MTVRLQPVEGVEGCPVHGHTWKALSLSPSGMHDQHFCLACLLDEIELLRKLNDKKINEWIDEIRKQGGVVKLPKEEK